MLRRAIVGLMWQCNCREICVPKCNLGTSVGNEVLVGQPLRVAVGWAVTGRQYQAGSLSYVNYSPPAPAAVAPPDGCADVPGCAAGKCGATPRVHPGCGPPHPA